FENRGGKYFPDLHTKQKYCLITLSNNHVGNSNFGFYLNYIHDIVSKLKVFPLSKEDFLLLNPNTKTCPIFRNTIDAEIVKSIYKKIPVVYNELNGRDNLNIQITEMFHMSGDSNKFIENVSTENNRNSYYP